MGQMRKFKVVIELDEDGFYFASVPELRGCHTQGKTMDEAIERIREAIQVCLEDDDDFGIAVVS